MERNLCLLLALSTVNATLRGHNGQSHSSSTDTSSSRRRLSAITALHDATIRSDTPYTNYGLDDNLSFIGNPTSGTLQKVESLLKFDLTLLGSWGNRPHEQTFLQLYTGDCNFSTLPHANQLGLLQVGVAENNMAVGKDVETWQWDEESVTWFNSPLTKEHGGKMVKSLKLLEEKTWVEIDISSLVHSLSTPTLTLRLSSVIFAHSDDNLSLCTFASRNYRDGMFAPRLVTTTGLSSLNTQDEPSTVDQPAMATFTSNIVGIQPQDMQDQENEVVAEPHKIFHTPKLHSKENLIAQTATTEKVTKCAPPYSTSAKYAHNDVASSQNNNYRCKGHPYTVWCSEEEYEPGVSLFWGLAWDLVNACKTEVASIHSKESDTDTSFKEPATIIDTPSGDSAAMTLNSQSSVSSSAPLCPDKWNFVYPYTTGDRVTLPSTLIIYECKEQPFGYYCAHEAYEVGLEGGVYENAWKPIGKCVNGRVVEDQHYLDGKSDAEHAEEQESMSHSSSQAGSNLVRPTAIMNTQSSPNSISDLEVPEEFKTNVKCNLCEPGQIGINAEIPIDGGVAKCMDIYEYYLQNFLEGTKQCDAAQDWLNSICCGDESMMNAAQSSTTSTTGASAPPTKKPVTLNPTPRPTPEPITPEPTSEPIALPQDIDTSDSLASIYSQDANLPECATPYSSSDGSYKLNDRVSHTGGNYVCMMSSWCSESDFEPRNGKYWMTVWEFESACKQPEGLEEVNPQQQRPTNFDTDGDSFAEADQDSEQPPPPPSPEEEPEEIVEVSPDTTAVPVAGLTDTDSDSFAEFDQDSEQPPPPPPLEEEPEEIVEVSPDTTAVPVAGLTDQPEEIIEDSPETTAVPVVVETLQDPTESAGLAAGGLPKCPSPWNSGHDYAEGDTVEAMGQIYSCKEFPYNGWCGLDAYEPAVGTYWVDAWNLGSDCVGGATKFPTASPVTLAPSSATPTGPPMPTTSSPTKDPSSPVSNVPDNDPNTLDKVYSILEEKKDALDNEIFLYQGSEPSSVYRYDGFVGGLKVMTDAGVAGKFYYLGDGSENGYKYGLVNLAAFIGQSMKETIQYDACDENSWDLVDGKYPLSNACGQLGQKYEEYHCSEEEKHMECPVDPNMSIKGVTNAKWYGAPGPLFCGPKSEYEFTGFWDYGYGCNNPWADPPEFCEDYPDQKAGRYDNTEPVANVAGRTDVEGCCWWGRGVIQTTGVCNFGKLNYFLGARAAEEGREARYPDVDFCKDPEAICASEEHKELKWIAGMFYWVESLQSYSERGWDYITELHKFVDGGMEDSSFIDGVSGVVNRGCHDPPCGTGEVDGLFERASNFEKVLQSFLDR